jgi:protein-L-isoaspartate(D-aspartate) O-methyltransferase
VDAEPDYDRERAEMVDRQLAQRGIRSPAVLDAMRKIPRQLFVPEAYRSLAYQDGPLAIGEDQTISQPYIVGLMTEVLEVQKSDRVLEIGTGSGYQAAVLAELAAVVYTVEQHPALAEGARKALARAGVENVRIFIGDGSAGLKGHAPYDGILVAAAAPRIPRALLEQLSEGGRLVLPVGGRQGQQLQLVRRSGDRFSRKKLVPVAFVPLRGSRGWTEDSWK